jgi:ferredoxin-NADP reductase
MWAQIERPFDTQYYISGPPPMLRSIGDDLRGRDISAEAIHIDAWE